MISKLKGNQLKVYGILHKTPTMREICSATGLNQRQVEAAIKALRDKGYEVSSGRYRIGIIKVGKKDEQQK